VIKTDALVIGAGLSGLSFAHHWRKLGGSALVVEKKDRAGGLAGSVSTPEGFTFDYTGHLLHLHDPYGKKLILNLLKGNVALHERSAWICSQRTLTRYPFQANTYGLPLRVVDDCVVGALKARRAAAHKKEPESFQDVALRTFGAGVCRHFMFPDNEKLWRTNLKRLGTDWQGRFIPRPSAEEVLYGALTDQKKFFGYNALFRYPVRGGAQALPDALAARVPEVTLGAGVRKVDLREKVAVVDGLGEVGYERLVNTMPLDSFLGLCDGLPDEVRQAGSRLRCNTVYNLNIGIGRANVSDKHWIYFPGREFMFYRAGFTSNFSPNMAPAGTSSMYIEIARRPGEPFKYAEAEKACVDGLRRAGILKFSDKLRSKIWLTIPCAYVVYDFERAPALAKIFPFLNASGVESIGRYGAWKYSFMEEAVLDGKRCAEKLAGVAVSPEKKSEAPLQALK
jgi:protoporphyrinogen oxidase